CHAVDKVFIGDKTKPQLVGRLGLSAERTGIVVAQGGEQPLEVTITRIDAGNVLVSVTVEDVPDGVTATVANGPPTAAVTTSRVTFQASTAAKPGNYPVTLRASSENIPSTTLLVTLTITEPPSFSLAVLTPSLTINRNGSARANIVVARKNTSAPV